jgi:hypothetical protein
MSGDHLCLYRPRPHDPRHPQASRRCEITFEQGDITESGRKADLLIISAFAGDYAESRRSVIGALARKGLSVKRQVRPGAESAGAASCWLSAQLEEDDAQRIGANRILCYESAEVWGEGGARLGELQSMFSALLTRAPHPGQLAWSVHMPLLGAGCQGADPAFALKLIVGGLQEAFATGLNVSSVRIIEKDSDKFRSAQGVFQELCDSYDPFTAGADPDPKYRLFISYSHADKDVVRAAYEEVRSDVVPDIFIDCDGGVNQGMILHRDLAMAVRQSRAMIAVISEAYVASPACRVEFATAYNRHYLRPGGFVLKPIFRSDPGSFPPEYRDVMGEGVDVLRERILELAGRDT